MVEQHARIAADWPWWVQFWEIHPGISRTQASQPLEHQLNYAIGFLIAFALLFGLSQISWYWNAATVLAAILFLTMVVLALWLRKAIRWVDRHGAWGGEHRAVVATRTAGPVNGGPAG